MIARKGRVVCDVCGKFIAYTAIADQSARHSMVNPDAYGFEERWESLCPKCLEKEVKSP